MIARRIFNYFRTLNLFQNRLVNDEHEIRNQLISTRLYLCSFYVIIFIFMILNGAQKKIETITIDRPSIEIYQELQTKYPNCPCAEISIPYKNFVILKARFHQICASDFVTEEWFSFIEYSRNENHTTFVDFRVSGPLQFRLLNRLCTLAIHTMENALKIFDNHQFVTNTIYTENEFDLRIHQITEEFLSSTTKQFILSLDLVRSTTHGNQLLSGLFTNYYLSGNDSNDMQLHSTGYQHGKTLCHCLVDANCNQESWLYDNPYYFPLTHVEGMVTGCYIFDSLLQSNLMCFYNSTCLNSMRKNSDPAFRILNRSESKASNETIETIVKRLMIDQWNTNISFEKYFNACRPLSCSYTRMTHPGVIPLFTTFIGLCSGLTGILRCVIPRFIRQVRKRGGGGDNRQCCKRLMEKFSLFPFKPNDDDYTKTTKRIMTILYFIFFFISFLAMTLYFSLISNLKTGRLNSPTIQQYNETILQHPTMICSCTNLGITHADFLSFHPRFHQLCSSHFIESSWIDILIDLNLYTNDGDFQRIALAQFRTLQSFCELSNRTVSQAIESFNTEYFITTSFLSKDILEKQSQTLIKTFISSISKNFIQALHLLDITTKGNDLFSALLTNYRMIVNDDKEIDTIPMKYQSCNCSENNQSCVQETTINTNPVHGFYIGCYLIDALRQSTLECFYNQSCLSNIHHSSAIAPLDSSIPSRYSVNTTMNDLLKNLLIEQWNETIVYSSYFNACNVSNCRYIYSARNSWILIISNVIGLLMGLNSVFVFLVPLIVENIRRKSSSINPNISLNKFSLSVRQSIQRWKTYIGSYTIFRTNHRYSTFATRLYYLVLIILMVAYSLYTLTRTVEETETMKNPTIEQFEELHRNYSDTLICHCDQISIKYREIFSIKPIYHPICSRNIFIDGNLSHQFRFLQSLCQITHDTTELAIDEFLENNYISGAVLHQSIFEYQTKATILDLFTSSIQQSFKRSLDLIRITTFSNQILSSRFTNWKFRLFYHRYYQTWLTTNMPVSYQYMNITCDCFQSSECKEESRQIRHFYFGCSILESLFQSTLEGFDHSQTNETIEHIVERLMINDWQSNSHYKIYYQKCHPKSCIYRTNAKPTLLYLMSMLLVIYSGLSYLLRSVVRLIMFISPSVQ